MKDWQSVRVLELAHSSISWTQTEAITQAALAHEVGAERSFSLLKLEKTYLRSSMSKERLNSLTLNNMHKDVLIDHAEIAKKYLQSPAEPLPLDDHNDPQIDLEMMDDLEVREQDQGPRDMEAYMDMLNEA